MDICINTELNHSHNNPSTSLQVERHCLSTFSPTASEVIRLSGLIVLEFNATLNNARVTVSYESNTTGLTVTGGGGSASVTLPPPQNGTKRGSSVTLSKPTCKYNGNTVDTMDISWESESAWDTTFPYNGKNIYVFVNGGCAPGTSITCEVGYM